MESFLVHTLQQYLRPHFIPLYVEEVIRGKHPENCFHGHTFMEIVLVVDGTAEHIVDGIRHPITAGDVLLLNPGLSHAYDHTETLHIINLTYDPQALSMPLLDSNQLPKFSLFTDMAAKRSAVEMVAPVIHLDNAVARRIYRVMQELEDELNSSLPARMFRGLALFMSAIAMLCREFRSEDCINTDGYLVGNAIAYMNSHFSEDIQIEQLPAMVNMSRRNFFYRFRRSTGYAPAEYLREIRLSRAKEMLLQTEYPISEIALDCGFCDGNHMCRIFRQHTGCTPREFRLKGLRSRRENDGK